MSELLLRSYQQDAIQKLRLGFEKGIQAQILYLGTGAGKTEVAIALLEATRKKGNRAAMILDRIILCDQTSQRLEKYSIDHGVMQSGHWRYRPHERIQVCSAQTLERKGEFPGLSLLIVDEAHQSRQQTIEFIKNNPDVRVIGLTATPFTKGLGKTYKGVVSTITTKQLVDQSVLVPLKVFISKEIDMTGAKKVAGEWSQTEATTRGMKITGDIVSEWVKKTHDDCVLLGREPRRRLGKEVCRAGLQLYFRQLQGR
jgi:DNA repair protein RadD